MTVHQRYTLEHLIYKCNYSIVYTGRYKPLKVILLIGRPNKILLSLYIHFKGFVDGLQCPFAHTYITYRILLGVRSALHGIPGNCEGIVKNDQDIVIFILL